jgi:hypothetical protein
VSTIINRIYGTYGSRQQDIAEAKAKANIPAQSDPEKTYVTDITTAVKSAISGSMTHEQLDKAINDARHFYQGAMAEKMKGKLYSSDIQSYMPGQPEYQKALSGYYELMDREISSYGGQPDAAQWRTINNDLDTYLSKYDDKIAEYVRKNKLAWTRMFPPEIRQFLEDRDQLMQSGEWFNGYKTGEFKDKYPLTPETTTYNWQQYYEGQPSPAKKPPRVKIRYMR